MSTRSNIVVQRNNSALLGVFCHLDGGLDGVGQTLLNHYATQELAESLVAGGDVHVLRKFHRDPPAGHSASNPAPDHTVYYGRDGGHANVGPRLGTTIEAVESPDVFGAIEYYYLWCVRPRAWFVMASYPDTGGEFIPLAKAIKLEFGRRRVKS